MTNLTPHPVLVFGWEVPDRFEAGEHQPLLELPPSGTVARIGEIDLGDARLRGADTLVEMIEYRHVNGLPPKPAGSWDEVRDWYVVSLALALACSNPADPQHRADLLVPYRELRNAAGTVVGCRTLALPV